MSKEGLVNPASEWSFHRCTLLSAVLLGALLVVLECFCLDQQNYSQPIEIEESIAASRANGRKGIKLATEFQWLVTASDDSATPGFKTVHLPHCPAGVSGSEQEYFVLLSGSGKSEPVKVTGGTCKGDDQPGTFQCTIAIQLGRHRRVPRTQVRQTNHDRLPDGE